MQQFTVPQFIDVEDKIIGPITTRQFIIMMICAMFMAIGWKVFDFPLFVTTGTIEVLLFGIVAFVKINGRPFHFFVLNVVQTIKRPRLRVWDLYGDDDVGDGIYSGDLEDLNMTQEKRNKKAKNNPTGSRLTELSLIVDTQGGYKGENAEGETKIIAQ